MDGPRFPPLQGNPVAPFADSTRSVVPTRTIRFPESPSGSPLPRRQRRIVKLLPAVSSIAISKRPEWSDFLKEDFPELPLLSDLPLSPPPARQPQPETVIRIKPTSLDPIMVLFHGSLSIPPLIGLEKLRIPLGDARLIAHELFVRYLKILTCNNDEVNRLYVSCLHVPSMADNLLFPALMARGLVVRPPLPRDLSIIQEYLPCYPVDELQDLLQKEGEQCDGLAKRRLMVMTPLYLPFSPFGLIMMDIFPISNGFNCRIVTLHIVEKERRRGLATLLLNYGVLWAKSMQCREIYTDATPQNLCFCIRMGFRPFDPHLNAQNWHSADFYAKLLIAHNYCINKINLLTFDLEEHNRDLSDVTQHVLNPYYAARNLIS